MDIESETKLAELRRSEEQYRRLLNEMSDGYVITREGQILFSNQRMEEMLGYPPGALVGRSWKDFLTFEMARFIDQTPMADLPPLLDVKIQRHNGSQLDAELAIRSAFYQDELAEFTIVRDVTERKQMEKRTRIQRDLGIALSGTSDLDKALRLCVEAAISMSDMDSGGIYLLNERTHAFDLAFSKSVSSEFKKTVHHIEPKSHRADLVRAGEPIYTTHKELGVPMDQWRRREGLQALAVIPILHKNQVIACLNLASHTTDEIPLTARNALEAMGTQIGSAIARLRAEEALRKSKELAFRTVADFTYDWEYWVSPEGQYLYISPSCERITEYSVDAFIQDSDLLQAITHPKDRGLVTEHLDQELTSEQAHSLDFRIITRSGQVRWINHVCQPVYSGDGKWLGRRASNRDITDRKRVEETLRESEERYRFLIEKQGEGLSIVDDQERIILCNQVAEEIFGVRPGELQGQSLRNFLSPKDFERVRKQTQRRQLGERSTYEAQIIRPDGERRQLLVTATPWLDEQGEFVGTLAVFRDDTERKQAEAELRRRNLELGLLNRASQALISTLDLDKVLTTLLDELRHLLGVAACSVWLIDSQTCELVCHQATGPKSQVVRGWRLKPEEGLAGWVAKEGKSLIVANAQTDSRHCHQVENKMELTLHSIISVPLRVTTGVIGVLQALHSEPDYFEPRDLSILEPMAATAAMAIENARLYEQAKRDAETRAVLLNEVNHRVKNNLSTIVGLLYAARRYVEVEEKPIYESLMNDLIYRVQGLSTVHSMLSAAHWKPLPLTELTIQAMRSVLQALPHNKRVTANVSPSNVYVTPDQASNLALIINELTTNAIKYAFVDRDRGQISVRIDREKDGVRFEFRDDGPGYPQEVLSLGQHSAGFDLIQNIARKSLRGELSLHNDQGAVTVFYFDAEASAGEKSQC